MMWSRALHSRCLRDRVLEPVVILPAFLMSLGRFEVCPCIAPDSRSDGLLTFQRAQNNTISVISSLCNLPSLPFKFMSWHPISSRKIYEKTFDYSCVNFYQFAIGFFRISAQVDR